LRRAARAAAEGADAIACEGVGGLMVPLSPTYLVRDLAADLGYPVVVVAGPGLGTINHTLLTLEVARAVGLEVAAVVLTPWPAEPTEIERSNRETIATLGAVEVLTLPNLDISDPSSWPNLLPTGLSRSI
jgi:dethiobiotin synthetase